MKRKGTAPSQKMDNFSFVDPTSRNFIYDEVDDFHDKINYDMHDGLADGDYDKETTKEQVIGLKKGCESDEIDYTDDDDDDDDLIKNDIYSSRESDNDDQDDERTMGKKKKYFFGTDLTDERIHNTWRFQNKKRGYASLELEIEGAKKLQERMRKEMGHGLFSAQLFTSTGEREEETLPDKIREIELNSKTSISPSKSSKNLKKPSSKKAPFLFDFEERVEELSNRLSPLMEAKKKGILPFNSATQYLQARYLLCLNYLSIVSAYMMVKSSGMNMSEHPAETRLAQYRHLFVELELCKRKYDTELTALLSDLKSGKLKVTGTTKGQRKMLVVVKAAKAVKRKRPAAEPSSVEDQRDSDTEEKMEVEQERKKDGKLQPGCILSEGEQSEKVTEIQDDPVKEQTRRVITREITKNKGLLPSRRKEQRNPRVNYKKKYKQKLKRRKGQVREVRRETERYAGEISGIKANVIKSIKLK